MHFFTQSLFATAPAQLARQRPIPPRNSGPLPSSPAAGNQQRATLAEIRGTINPKSGIKRVWQGKPNSQFAAHSAKRVSTRSLRQSEIRSLGGARIPTICFLAILKTRIANLESNDLPMPKPEFLKAIDEIGPSKVIGFLPGIQSKLAEVQRGSAAVLAKREEARLAKEKADTLENIEKEKNRVIFRVINLEEIVGAIQLEAIIKPTISSFIFL
jgi:hypothetical protein